MFRSPSECTALENQPTVALGTYRARYRHCPQSNQGICVVPRKKQLFADLRYSIESTVQQPYFLDNQFDRRQAMSALNTDELPIESKDLEVPTLLEIQGVLATGLPAHFRHVTVEVVDCPDLRQAPFHLAAEGLSGSPAIVDIGGPPFLLPLVDRTKIYDLREIGQRIQPDGTDILAIGAGAGYYPMLNCNTEGMYNLRIDKDGSTTGSATRFAINRKPDEKCVLHTVPADETRSCLLVNLLMCEGKPGKVIRVYCRQRIAAADFVTAVRTTLATHYDKNYQIVGLGGVFLLKTGAARQHVMRDFSATPLRDEAELNAWLKFHEMPAPLIAVGTLMTADADLDIRIQHFHSFSTGNWGGHYHNDTTPDTCEYEAFFAVGERIVRVDKPLVTHQFGRD